jgi:plastocyanin
MNEMKTLHELLLWRYIPLFLVMMAVLLMPAFSAEVNVSEKALNISDLKNVTVDLIAQNMTFNTSMITVPAGANVTVNFDNRDVGIRHNFAVYDSAAMKKIIFRGELISGPRKIVYVFDAPKESGIYRFQCDPHASFMNGQFIVK